MSLQTTHSRTIHVTGMTCEHCVAAVTEELSALNGVHTVTVTLSDGAVTIGSSRTVADAELSVAVLAAGYAIAD